MDVFEEGKAMRYLSYVILLVPTCLLGGCEEEKERTYELTPNGYFVAFDGYQGTPYATVPELYAAFDAAMIRAAGELYRYGVQPETTEAVARKVGFLLIDNTRFQVPDGRWAYGANFGEEMWIGLYRDQSAAPGTPFPADAIPWTCRIGTSTGKTYWAVWNINDLYPTLGHEIGHTIFGNAFEHTYFPPIINP
jgi:hypothetical protein